MATVLTVGLNSYGLLSEADDYLDDSLRAAALWEAMDTDKKKRALITATRLIERQRLLGTAVGYTVVQSLAIQAAGTGYAVGAIVTVSGGTFAAPALATVATIGGSGAVTSLELLDAGLYTAVPSNPAATTSSGGGSGLTVNLTTSPQVLHFPASGLIDPYGVAITSTGYPLALRQAEYELAFELTRNAALETSTSTGNDKKSLKAGSAAIEFFRPTAGSRFPTIVQELLVGFIAGFEVLAPVVGGLENTSLYDAGDLTPSEGL